MISLRDEILKYSFEKQLTHVPSALSMFDYLYEIFNLQVIQPYKDKIVIGKPFGSQAYYIIWKHFGWLNDIENLSMGVKHDEIDFVDYSEETMGNALGIGAGIATACENRVWVNITDATLQMGSTLEAIQYIGQKKINNIFLTVDFNNRQVTGRTSDIIDARPVINFLQDNNWNVFQADGHDKKSIKLAIQQIENSVVKAPSVIIFHTEKGHGVDYMVQNPVKWHYKPIDKLKIK